MAFRRHKVLRFKKEKEVIKKKTLLWLLKEIERERERKKKEL